MPAQIESTSFCQLFEQRFNSENMAFQKEVKITHAAFWKSSYGQMIIDIQNSHYTKARKPFFKAFEKLHYVAELFFDHFLPNTHLPGLAKQLKNRTICILSKSGTLFALLDKLFNFFSLLSDWNLLHGLTSLTSPDEYSISSKKPCRILRKYTKIKENLQSPAKNTRSLAKLKAIKLVERVLDAPEIIYAFSSIFLKTIPLFFKQIILPFNIAKLVFSSVGPFIIHHKSKSTAQLIYDFKIKKYRTFIREYSNKGGLRTSKHSHLTKEKSDEFRDSSLKKLSLEELKEWAKEIREDWKTFEKKPFLEAITYQANLAFIAKVNKELHHPDNVLVKKHFRVKKYKIFQNSEKASETHFLNRIAPTNVLKDQVKVEKIVKAIKARLNEKVVFDSVSIALKIASFIPSVFSIFVAIISAYTPYFFVGNFLTPIVAGCGGVLATIAFVEIFWLHHREEIFVKQMKKLTK